MSCKEGIAWYSSRPMPSLRYITGCADMLALLCLLHACTRTLYSVQVKYMCTLLFFIVFVYEDLFTKNLPVDDMLTFYISFVVVVVIIYCK